jgi:hypothetical protein
MFSDSDQIRIRDDSTPIGRGHGIESAAPALIRHLGGCDLKIHGSPGTQDPHVHRPADSVTFNGSDHLGRAWNRFPTHSNDHVSCPQPCL